MTDNSSSPVRPPVLDGKARTSSTDNSSTAKPSAKSSAPKKSAAASSPHSNKSSGIGFFAIVLAAISGAVLAILVIVLLASTGTLNQLAPNTNDARAEANALSISQDNLTSQLDGLRGRIANLESNVEGQAQNIKSVADLAEQSALANQKIENSFTADMSAFTSQVNALEEQVTSNQFSNQQAVEATAQGTSNIDAQIENVESQLDNFSNRLEAVAAGASAEDAANLSNRIEELLTQNGSLRDELNALTANSQTTTQALAEQLRDAQQTNDGFNSRLNQSQSKIEELDTNIANLLAMRADLQTEQATVSIAAKLPIALSSFQSSVANGETYEQALQSLAALLPDLSIPPSVTENATLGLPSAQILKDEFQALVPQILTKLPSDPDANIAVRLTQSLQQAFAMRDASGEADSPQALVATIETALEAGDFSGAKTALEALPQPMQTVAAKIIESLDAHIAAQNLIAEARISVLAVTTQTQGASQ